MSMHVLYELWATHAEASKEVKVDTEVDAAPYDEAGEEVEVEAGEEVKVDIEVDAPPYDEAGVCPHTRPSPLRPHTRPSYIY